MILEDKIWTIKKNNLGDSTSFGKSRRYTVTMQALKMYDLHKVRRTRTKWPIEWYGGTYDFAKLSPSNEVHMKYG